ncbi:50S ribosomal protein L22 [Alkalispirochaeta sphaeroplastigenens]|uniref:Large ribosomal subunit protein uL22 n=1 Tax=Alkalispirochaeta sphaeroplastigenens TaxID=1187066 RepID=A0A2S4JGT8_9SPIO|nr:MULTISPECIES: 50S ribosomal protein L22 [Alkalispirochaeta]POQ98762.1 50S ribosomal protein L22 [Alkalispirochaeta sphaeroplastigenens]
MGYKAVAKYVRISPFKARVVADLVRRKPYPEAIAILNNLPNKGAGLIRKVIQSAAANALSNNRSMDEGMLYVSELYIDEGPRMKRLWVRGRGRADMLLKRMSHITAVVDRIDQVGE